MEEAAEIKSLEDEPVVESDRTIPVVSETCRLLQAGAVWKRRAGFSAKTESSRSLGRRQGGFEAVKTRSLRPTDRLLHICARGGKWARVPPVRWW